MAELFQKLYDLHSNRRTSSSSVSYVGIPSGIVENSEEHPHLGTDTEVKRREEDQEIELSEFSPPFAPQQTTIGDLSADLQSFLKSPSVTALLNQDRFEDSDWINTRVRSVTPLEVAIYGGNSEGICELLECIDIDLEQELLCDAIYTAKLRSLQSCSPETIHPLMFAFLKLTKIREGLGQAEECYKKATQELSRLQQQAVCDPSGFSLTTPLWNDCRNGELCNCCHNPDYGCDGSTISYFACGGWVIDGINCLVTHLLCAPWIYRCDPGLPAQRALENRTVVEFQHRIQALKKQENAYIQFIGKLVKRCLAAGKLVSFLESQFLAALRQGDIDIPLVEIMLKNGIDPNLRIGTDHGNTALILATQASHFQGISLLVQYGANLSMANDHGSSALMMAAQMANLQVVSFLLEMGADTTIALKNMQGLTAADLAEQQKNQSQERCVIYDILRDTQKMFANYGISEYEINRALDGAKIHAEDRPRFSSAIATAHRERIKGLPLDLRWKTLPGFAVEVMSEIIRRDILHILRGADIPANDENRYLGLILKSNAVEVEAMNDLQVTRHPFVWHFEHVLQTEVRQVIRSVNFPIENENTLLDNIIAQFKSQIGSPYFSPPVLTEIADDMITEYAVDRELADTVHRDDQPRYRSGMLARRFGMLAHHEQRRPRALPTLAMAALPDLMNEHALELLHEAGVEANEHLRYVGLIVEAYQWAPKNPMIWHFKQILLREVAQKIVREARIPEHDQKGLIDAIIKKIPLYLEYKIKNLIQKVEEAVTAYRIDREIEAARIHEDERKVYFDAITMAQTNTLDVSEAALQPEAIPQLVRRVLPLITRDLISRTVRMAHLPDPYRYADLINAAFNAEVGRPHHTIAWHAERVLELEAMEALQLATFADEKQRTTLLNQIIQEFKAQIAAAPKVDPVLIEIAERITVEYVVDDVLNNGFHMDDQPRYRSGMLACRFEVLKPDERRRPRSIPTLALAALPKIMQEHALELLRKAEVAEADQKQYAELIVSAYDEEVFTADDCHSMDWHFTKVLQRQVAEKIVRETNFPENDQLRMVEIIIDKFDSLAATLQNLMKVLSEIAKMVIVEFEINQILDAARIHANDRSHYFNELMTGYQHEVASRDLDQLLNAIAMLGIVVIPQVTRKLALDVIRSAYISPHEENRYCELIINSPTLEGEPQSIAWHFDQILQREALEAVQAAQIPLENHQELVGVIFDKFKSCVDAYRPPRLISNESPVFSKIVDTMIAEYKINRLLTVARIHGNDRPRYFERSVAAYADQQDNGGVNSDSKSIAELVFRMITIVTQELAREAVQAAKLSDEDRYVALISQSHAKEVVGLGEKGNDEEGNHENQVNPEEGCSRHTIAWHLDSVMRQEVEEAIVKAEIQLDAKQGLIVQILQAFKSQRAAEPLVPFVLTAFAERRVAEYVIQEAFQSERIHDEDRQRYRDALLARRFSAAINIQPKTPWAPLGVALAQTMREHASELVRTLHLNPLDEKRLIDSIVTARNKEADLGGTQEREENEVFSHPMAWHFEQALEKEALKRLQEAYIPVDEHLKLQIEIMKLYKRKIPLSSEVLVFADIVQEVIKKLFEGMSREQVEQIVEHCTDFMTTDIPSDPVILQDLAVWRPANPNDLPPEGEALEIAENTATVQRHKIYSKSSVKSWFRYRTTTYSDEYVPRNGIKPDLKNYTPGDDKTRDDQLLYCNASGDPDPQGFPIASHAKHPLFSGAILEYVEAKFYDAKPLLTMQMIAAAQAINQNASGIEASSLGASLNNNAIKESVIVWRYLNGRNPNTGKMEAGWLTQREIDTAITALNTFIADPYPQHQAGDSAQTIKTAKYLRFLRIHRLQPLLAQNFVMTQGISVVGVETDRQDEDDEIKQSSELQTSIHHNEDEIKQTRELGTSSSSVDDDVPPPQAPVVESLIEGDDYGVVYQAAILARAAGDEDAEVDMALRLSAAQLEFEISQQEAEFKLALEISANAISNVDEVSGHFGVDESKHRDEQRNIVMFSSSSSASSVSSNASSLSSNSVSSSSGLSSSSSNASNAANAVPLAGVVLTPEARRRLMAEICEARLRKQAEPR